MIWNPWKSDRQIEDTQNTSNTGQEHKENGVVKEEVVTADKKTD
jgi:hypothetical protein